MNISFNWLNDYITSGLNPEEIAAVLTSTGLEVESIDPVDAVPGGLRGVVVGEVIECAPHPDADRLRITQVDLGSGDPLQIVCGAPNVAQGQKVLVATVGTTLRPSEGDSFIIKKSKIRGAESLGMICAEDELGLGTSHEGILVLNNALKPGTPAADALEMPSDYCLSIGLTPNRTDAFSHLGVARELSAALANAAGREPVRHPVEEPVVAVPGEVRAKTPIKVSVSDEEACPRYAGVVLQGLRIGPSPSWLQRRLAAIGVRPINNIVDVTNYVQHECGQPLHAFDLEKVRGSTVQVRRAQVGERLITLDGIDRELHADDLVIADGQGPMCLAGIFGGQDSGVSEATTALFLESAWFHASVVRKAARRHGLNTDSSFRFERGTDPSRVLWALRRAAQLITEVAGGEIASEEVDCYPRQAEPMRVNLRFARVNAVAGTEIPIDKIRNILADLDFREESVNEHSVRLTVPLNRVDVTREADVIEEILRIYGFDAIGFPNQMRTTLSEAPKPDPDKIGERLADALAVRGYHEIMGMSMYRLRYLALSDSPEYSDATAVRLLNPLSSDLGVMRQTLLYGGLQSIALNRNHRRQDLRLFELGKEYRLREGRTEERQKLMILLTGRRLPESWNTSSDSYSFSDIRAIVDLVLRMTGVSGVKTVSLDHPLFTEGIEWNRGKHAVVRAGLVRGSILREFDLDQEVWYAEFDWNTLITCVPKSELSYQTPEKYPVVRRDLSLLLNKAVTFGEIESVAFAVDRKILREVNLFDVYEGRNIEPEKKSYAVSFVLQDAAKTMTDDQVDRLMENIRKALAEKLGATLR